MQKSQPGPELYWDRLAKHSANALVTILLTFTWYHSQLAMNEFPGRYELHQAMTSVAVLSFQDSYFDFIYVDATHLYKDSKADIEAYWSKLRVGGVMAGDDYFSGFVDAAGYSFGVKDAVDEFFARKNHRVQLTSSSQMGAFIGGDFLMQQWYVLKCAE